MRLSDTIEQFIKTMLVEETQEIELKRNELAEYFNCAPSQINYVLSTRFTPDHGYIIESRRGGGGCIRIFRMKQSTGEQLLYLIHERIGDSIDAVSANHYRRGSRHHAGGDLAAGAQSAGNGADERCSAG